MRLLRGACQGGVAKEGLAKGGLPRRACLLSPTILAPLTLTALVPIPSDAQTLGHHADIAPTALLSCCAAFASATTTTGCCGARHPDLPTGRRRRTRKAAPARTRAAPETAAPTPALSWLPGMLPSETNLSFSYWLMNPSFSNLHEGRSPEMQYSYCMSTHPMRSSCGLRSSKMV